jgi:hypothetical protein
MGPGENYPSDNAQVLTCRDAIAAIKQGNKTRVLRRRFSVDRSSPTITGTLCGLTDGLAIAVAIDSHRLVAIKNLTATDSHHALVYQTMYEKTLARQIVAYLREHPLSGDTLEGVSRWWIKKQCITECVRDVHQALVRLGNEGLVHERATPDGRTLFFANVHAEELDVVENARD